MASHSSILAWSIPWTEGSAGYSPWAGEALDTTDWPGTPIAHTAAVRGQELNSTEQGFCREGTRHGP